MIKKIKNWIQRHIYGVGFMDVYSCDVYFTKIILKTLKLFKKKVEEYGGYPVHFKNEKEWLDTLDRIITGFELLKKDDEGEDIYYKLGKEKGQKWIQDYHEETFSLFSKYYRSFWY